MHPAFSQIDHRPWPLPEQSWLLKQRWLNLLFVHWEVDPDYLRKQIPEPLEIDTHGGKAWIALVPFDMKDVSLKYVPPMGPLSDFPEINVRTYVEYQGKPGVWFFSLDVPKRIPVWIARSCFHLPYRYGSVAIAEEAGRFTYTHQCEKESFVATYQGLAPVNPEPGSFEDWATERYCLYCASKRGQIYRTEVQHPKWPLQKAELDIHTNSLLHPFPTGDAHPSVLFSKHLEVVAYPPQKIY